MTLQPVAVLGTAAVAVVTSFTPNIARDSREGAPFILPQGVISSKDGPLTVTAYGCVNVYKGTKLVASFPYYAGNGAGNVFVPRGYSITNCSPQPSQPSYPIAAVSGYEGT
jgi:hypothetical protein